MSLGILFDLGEPLRGVDTIQSGGTLPITVDTANSLDWYINILIWEDFVKVLICKE